MNLLREEDMKATQVIGRPVAAIAGAAAGMSDIEAAHSGHAHAVDAVRQLEQRIEQAFAKLNESRHELQRRADVDAVVNFTDPMRAAWDVWLATETVREHREQPAPESLNADAVRLANSHGKS